MAIRADARYVGEVKGGSLFQANSGTMGYQVWLVCDEGEIDYAIWLTQKTKDNGKAEKEFDVLGIPPEALRTRAGIMGIDEKIRGVKVAFGTKSETYHDKTTIKVAWIGKPKPTGDMFALAASLFSGTEPETVDPDESVPF